eukprot:SAG11_NODE_7360_length_1156_cov_1.215705_1_plen_62_part_00
MHLGSRTQAIFFDFDSEVQILDHESCAMDGAAGLVSMRKPRGQRGSMQIRQIQLKLVDLLP